MKKRLINAVRNFRHAFWEHVDSSASMLRLCRADQRAISHMPQIAQPDHEQYHLLLLSSGVNNIGDQAMFESFLANVSGPIIALCRDSATYTIPSEHEQRTKLVRLSGLVYGRGPNHRAAVRAFTQLTRDAISFSVVGADIMDGGYQSRTSVIEWNLAAAVSKLGIDTRILGFSWGSAVPTIVCNVAADAVSVGVTPCVRDICSFQRFEHDTQTKGCLVADLVFSLNGVDRQHPSFSLAQRLALQGPLLLMNISSLIARQAALVSDYVSMIIDAQRLGYSILLVPHVGDVSGGDRAVIREVVSRTADASGSSPPYIDELLTPLQIRALATNATLTITGRMHLSILSMSVGTPALVLSTHGKVDGLMKMIGLPEWSVDPTPGFAQKVLPLIQAFTADPDAFRDPLMENLERVRDLSHRNFDGL